MPEKAGWDGMGWAERSLTHRHADDGYVIYLDFPKRKLFFAKFN
jgi:hypothetical protein